MTAFPIEDALYTGLLADRAGVQKVNARRFMFIHYDVREWEKCGPRRLLGTDTLFNGTLAHGGNEQPPADRLPKVSSVLADDGKTPIVVGLVSALFN